MTTTSKPWKTEKSRAAALMRCADHHGMSIKAVAKHNDLLKPFKVAKKKVTPATIAHAELLRHKWDEDIQNRVKDINGENEALELIEKKEEILDKAIGKKKPKAKANRDAFGAREGSTSYKMNEAILEHGASDAAEMAEHSGVAKSRCTAHIKWLLERDYIAGERDDFTVNDGE